MFIKKDRRKIEEILVDPTDSREYLKLSKRAFELQGGVHVVCNKAVVSSGALNNLKVLNLYNNSISNLEGIGLLSSTPVEDINLGSNCLTKLPVEFSELGGTLLSLWLDDNELTEFPLLPLSPCALLATLRLSSNHITAASIPHPYPAAAPQLHNLVTLALDHNDLHEFPRGLLPPEEGSVSPAGSKIGGLTPNLRHLWLRQNLIQQIPDAISAWANTLETLAISSNFLTELPSVLCKLTKLRVLYANGNKIKSVPAEMPVCCTCLEVVNLANNLLRPAAEAPVMAEEMVESHKGLPDDDSSDRLPAEWISYWGPYEAASGELSGGGLTSREVAVTLIGNKF